MEQYLNGGHPVDMKISPVWSHFDSTFFFHHRVIPFEILWRAIPFDILRGLQNGLVYQIVVKMGTFLFKVLHIILMLWVFSIVFLIMVNLIMFWKLPK